MALTHQKSHFLQDSDPYTLASLAQFGLQASVRPKAQEKANGKNMVPFGDSSCVTLHSSLHIEIELFLRASDGILMEQKHLTRGNRCGRADASVDSLVVCVFAR